MKLTVIYAWSSTIISLLVVDFSPQQLAFFCKYQPSWSCKLAIHIKNIFRFLSSSSSTILYSITLGNCSLVYSRLLAVTTHVQRLPVWTLGGDQLLRFASTSSQNRLQGHGSPWRNSFSHFSVIDFPLFFLQFESSFPFIWKSMTLTVSKTLLDLSKREALDGTNYTCW